MREHKQQVFDDFAAAADWLVAEGRTDRDRLAIRGGSNGGLLVAAALTQRPDLCRAVVCAVPLTRHGALPAVPHRPAVDRPSTATPTCADEFAWLWAYSPYHHVVDGTCYPATLVLTGEEDSRVDPCHARKFGAAPAGGHGCGDERPILLRVESRAGHGQGKPASQAGRRGRRRARLPPLADRAGRCLTRTVSDDVTDDVFARRSRSRGRAPVADRAATVHIDARRPRPAGRRPWRPSEPPLLPEELPVGRRGGHGRRGRGRGTR